MNGHTQMPAISFGPDCTYDTLDWLMHDMCARVWLKQGVILVALWKSASFDGETVELKVWSDAQEDYANVVHIPYDDITKVEVL